MKSFYSLYKGCEIIEIKWIYVCNNPADSITKHKSSLALKTLIDVNCISLNITE